VTRKYEPGAAFLKRGREEAIGWGREEGPGDTLCGVILGL
jgi:hypothetical protein